VNNHLAAPWVVAAHAAQPQAILLAAVEDGQPGLLNELVALAGGQAQGVRAALQSQEELGAVVVRPGAGVDRAAAQADEDGKMLDAHRALELACAAGSALEDGFLGVVAAQQRLLRGGALLVEEAAQAEDDFLGIEQL